MTGEKQKLSFGLALFVLLGTAGIMCISIIFWGLDAHIPLLLSIVLVAIIGLRKGYTWKDIQEGIAAGINDAVEPVIILALVGLIIGTWILSGTVPTIIYYGLKMMSPQFFLVTAAIICAIVSTMTGSAWGTAGTVGIAFMGIGQGLGLPDPMVAGAILTGAYFGDKMSPMSDTTILASAIVRADIWDHIRSMFWTTIPGLSIALIAYGFLGFKYAGASAMNVENIELILNGISGQFHINIILLIPAILVIVLAVNKKPAIPTLLGSALLAGILAMIFQKGVTVKNVLYAMHYGYQSETGIEIIDKLLTKGGLNSMMWSISLILVALSFGGVLQKLEVMDAIIEKLLKYIRTVGSLVASNIIMCFLGNMMMGTQYMGIIIPGKMFQSTYKEMGIQPRVQSRILEDSATLTDCLIPWTIGASFFSATLGVSTLQYAPYVIMNYSVPIISIIYGFTGIAIFKLKDAEAKAK
ncbi:Na+/H+ antiporter NhaC [Clostridiaceae bacterium 35-E11]